MSTYPKISINQGLPITSPFRSRWQEETEITLCCKTLPWLRTHVTISIRKSYTILSILDTIEEFSHNLVIREINWISIRELTLLSFWEENPITNQVHSKTKICTKTILTYNQGKCPFRTNLKKEVLIMLEQTRIFPISMWILGRLM